MFRPEIKTRIFEDGRVEIVDPDIETLPLLKEINPEFRIRRTRLKKFSKPRLLATKKHLLPISIRDMEALATEDLCAIHDAALNENSLKHSRGELTLLDLKVELARRALRRCRLCGRQCGVDRLSGERGYCGLASEGKAGEYFVHIAEEAPINPSVNVSLRGCGLKCRFCQKHDLLDPKGPGHTLDSSLWKHLSLKVARSISFIGGNPDESLYAVLRFLKDAPAGLRKPIVWNSNGYGSQVVYRLLSGIVDAYIPDMKFYEEACSKELAGCENYFDMFRKGMEEMTKQNVSVFVRLLIIPGHLECCHVPLIDYLSDYREKVSLNIMGQYYPDHEINPKEATLNRRPTPSEIEHLTSYAEQIGGTKWLI